MSAEDSELYADAEKDDPRPKSWIEDAERRLQDYFDGKVEAIPGEEALRRIRAAMVDLQ